MKQALFVSLAGVVAVLVVATSAAGVAYWATARKFVPGDAHALDGIVRDPVTGPFSSSKK